MPMTAQSLLAGIAKMKSLKMTPVDILDVLTSAANVSPAAAVPATPAPAMDRARFRTHETQISIYKEMFPNANRLLR